MVTNYPQEIVTQPVATTNADVTSGTLLSRLWKRVQYALCSLHGHDPLLHYDQNRIYLRCASCGYETPGWELDQRRPRVRFGGNSEHPFVAHPHAFNSHDRERRIA